MHFLSLMLDLQMVANIRESVGPICHTLLKITFDPKNFTMTPLSVYTHVHENNDARLIFSYKKQEYMDRS